MSTDPRGRRDGREPLASADQLNAAIEALGIQKGDGPGMPRAQALGALLYVVEMLQMFDVDRLDAAAVRAGYLNMALMSGMAVAGEEQLPAGATIPGAEFTRESWDAATFAFGRMLEHRLNATLLDLEEMTPDVQPGEFSIGWPVTSWLRAITALLPHINVEEVDKTAILKSAKVAKRHQAEARQHLADLIKLASS